MRLALPEPHIPEKGGFTSENNIFGYHEFAERLANLVSNVKEPLVITLDGPWGSGKSVFIKQWAGLMRDRGGNIVYFDAFANDFHSNAFLALASEIYSIAKKTLGGNNPSSKKFLNKAKKIGEVITSRGSGIALRFITAGTVNPEDIEAAVKAFKNEPEKAISEKLQKADEERASLEAFRDSLIDVSKSIAKKNQGTGQSLPLIFIVDELDRCRPPFSLDIIEHIKHFFSVENICFVLVTNLSQMEAIIKNTYGSETNAHIYLEKFYQLKIVLPEPDIGQNQRNKYLNHLSSKLNLKFGDNLPSEIAFDEINHLANAHTLSLRQIEHMMRNIVLIAASLIEKQMPCLPVTAGLCIMRQTHPKLYALARENSLPWKDVEEFLKIDGIKYRTDVVNHWKYIIGHDIPEEIITQYSETLNRCYQSIRLPRDRRLLQHILTNDIDSLLGNHSNE